MQTFEYIAIPAPRKGQSAKGIKGVPGKFANAVTVLMNEMAAAGWEYQRSDTLPCEERQGLTGRVVKYHAMLVFRRAIESDAPQEEQLALPSPADEDVPADEPTSEPDEPVDSEKQIEKSGSEDDPFAEAEDLEEEPKKT